MNALLKTTIRRLPYLVLGGTLLVAGATAAVNKGDSKTETKPSPIKLVVDERPVTRDVRLGTSFSPIVKKVAPSVVKVTTSTRAKQASVQEMPGFDNPFFRRFFGEEFEQRQPRRQQNAPRQLGQGSGVIVTKDGYVLTNNHVVDEADEVKVVLLDGREFIGKVVGKDPKTDVAVLKIDGKDLPFIEMADSDEIEVGDIVLAVGNPFGIGQTVTMGMISATGRATLGLDYEDFIQTDAAINPGNSGGPLIDFEGRLLGMNTAIKSGTGGSIGLGYSIPANLIVSVATDLANGGKVVRGLIGVQGEDLSLAEATKLNLGRNGAVRVSLISEGLPAAKAGLKVGDIIVALDGKPFENWNELRLAISRHKPGEVLMVNFIREGRGSLARVTVAERTPDR